MVLIERRAYTLRPGGTSTFWQLQRDYNQGESMRKLLSHNICYFEALSGAGEQILHLYRFDTLDEWDETYRTLYRKHAPEYFAKARELLLTQETTFLRPPVSSEPVATGLHRPTGCEVEDPLVVETRLDLRPGGLDPYWRALDALDAADPQRATDRRLGVFAGLTGRLHRVYGYRWYESAREYEQWRRATATEDAVVEHHRAITPLVVGTGTALLRPSPVPSHRFLFRRQTP